MEMIIESLLTVNGVMSRMELMQATGLSDRAVRNEIARERELGAEIAPAKPYGYKLVETDAEYKALENMMIGKAVKMLTIVRKMRALRQSKGQLTVFGGNNGKHLKGNTVQGIAEEILANTEAAEMSLIEILDEFISGGANDVQSDGH